MARNDEPLEIDPNDVEEYEVDEELDLDLVCEDCGSKYSSEDCMPGEACLGCGGELQPIKKTSL